MMLLLNRFVLSSGPNSPHTPKKAAPSTDDTCVRRPEGPSTGSSLHSSPTVSPQGSPRKGGIPQTQSVFSLTHNIGIHLTLHTFTYTPASYKLSLVFELSVKSSFNSLTVGGALKQNSGQLHLSGSSSSLTSEASTRAAGSGPTGRTYGIGGAFLQKRILRMTCQMSRQEESRQRCEEPPRKRFRSPFSLFRSRDSSAQTDSSVRQDGAQSTAPLQRDRQKRRKTV